MVFTEENRSSGCVASCSKAVEIYWRPECEMLVRDSVHAVADLPPLYRVHAIVRVVVKVTQDLLPSS